MGDQQAITQVFGFDEHFGEGRMCRICTMNSKREFGVAGEFQLALSRRPVRDSDVAQLSVIVRRHGNRLDCFNIQRPPVEFSVVGEKAN